MVEQFKVHGGLTVTTKADHMDQFRLQSLRGAIIKCICIFFIRFCMTLKANGGAFLKIFILINLKPPPGESWILLVTRETKEKW